MTFCFLCLIVCVDVSQKRYIFDIHSYIFAGFVPNKNPQKWGFLFGAYLINTHYIGNRRLEGIGLDYRFPSDKNPFPWLSEVVDVQAMGNFFERRVREYQQSGALEDDF